MKAFLSLLFTAFCLSLFAQDFNLADYDNPVRFNPANRLNHATTRLQGNHFQNSAFNTSNLTYLKTSRVSYNQFHHFNRKLTTSPGNQYGISIGQRDGFEKLDYRIHFNKVLPKNTSDSIRTYFSIAKWALGSNIYLDHNIVSNTLNIQQDAGIQMTTKNLAISATWTKIYNLKPTLQLYGGVRTDISEKISVSPFILIENPNLKLHYYGGIIFRYRNLHSYNLSLITSVSDLNFQSIIEFKKGRYSDKYAIRLYYKVDKDNDTFGASFVYFINNMIVCFTPHGFWH